MEYYSKKFDDYFKNYDSINCLIGFVIIVGIVLLLIPPVCSFLGLLIIVISAYYLSSLNKSKNSVNDDFIDRLTWDAINHMENICLVKCGIEKNDLISESVSITSLPYRLLISAPTTIIKWRRGQDNVIRFTPIEVNVLHFTQHQLFLYKCVLDLITRKYSMQETEEYFYKDIVSVSTKTIVKDIVLNQNTYNLKQAEAFILTTTGGTSFEVILRDPQLLKAFFKSPDGILPINSAEKALNVVRKILREKKIEK